MTRRTLRTPDDLIAAGLSPANTRTELEAVHARYAIGITPHLIERIVPENPDDPVLKQFLPDNRELNISPQELADPIGDEPHSPVTGIVHRHPDRVLLKAVSVCPVYCRFCFRREMVGPDKDGVLSPRQLAAALDYIRNHPEIREVILTGGDPMMLSSSRAKAVTRDLNTINHVKIIRWHTRMPVADPDRVSADYASALKAGDKAIYVVLHANHANELSPEARAACRRLIEAGVTLLSQSVLLAGVNDTVEALADLMYAFVETGVKPYYLHHPDLAPGTSHFRLSVERGQQLMHDLRASVSGLCMPTYVVDIPGGVSKAVATPADVERRGDGLFLRGRDGDWREYQQN